MTLLDNLSRSRWHGGQLLAFSGLDGMTDWESGLNARTSFGAPGIDIRWPGRCRLEFTTTPLGAEVRHTVTSDTLSIPGLQLRAALLDAHHLLVEGPCQVCACDPAITWLQEGRRLLVGSATAFKPDRIHIDLDAAIAARQQWIAGCRLPSGLSDAAARTLSKAFSVLKGQVYTPEGVIQHRWTTPDRWPHRRMWLWDSAFHAIGWRHLDATLARDAISAVLDTQLQNGFIAHMMSPHARSIFTQPPVLAMAIRWVHESAPDRDWLREVYPRLCAYVRWDMANRDSDGAGLVEWAIEGDPMCRSGESGMDNSPRFDSATQLDAVDFNAFLAHECETLAGFARELGLSAEAVAWQAEHARLCTLINQRLWSDSEGFYLDFDVERKAASPVLASSGFLPLLCGAASPEQASRLVGHLRDPRMFASALPVPSIAVKDTGHYSKDMWRGPVWININWLIAEGLDRYGYAADARELRLKTAQEIEAQCERYGTLFEFYDDRGEVDPPALLRKGKCDPNPDSEQCNLAIHDYGWTATLYADLAHRLYG